MGDYVLEVGQDGADRLRRLDDVLGPYSRQFLLDSGLKPGMNVLELGCGTGNMTAWIAQQVGPGGKVVAVDASPEQIEIAKARCAKLGLSCVEFIASPVETLLPAESSFDVAYARLLLMHLRDPMKNLERMYAMLKPGGILATEEPNARSLFTYSAGTIFERMNDILLQMGEKLGLDFEIGDKLFGLHRELGSRVVRSHFVMPITSIAEAKGFIGLAAQEGMKAAIGLNLVTPDKASALLDELANLPNSTHGYYGWTRHAQIASVKSPGCREMR